MPYANLSPGATALSPDLERTASFDREGRLLYLFRRGETFKRSLASAVHRRTGRAGRRWERLGDDEAQAIFAEALALAAEVHAAAEPELRRRLEEEILPWTPAALAAEAGRFAAAYRPVAILPPDQYQAIVLQVTEGCTWNGCTFCNFYQDRPFALRSPAGLAAHAAAVADLLGRGLALRRGVFLADGNALAVARQRLEPLLDIVAERFPGRRLYGFVDLYGGERRPAEDFAALARRGLHRVYVGMETGLDELLAFVNKPGSRAELEAFVATLKAAAVAVSLIVMVGLGGRQHRDRHREATLAALAAMPLGPGDLLYLSPFVEHPGSVYAERRAEAGLSPMNEDEIELELGRFAVASRGLGIKTSRYDIREFIY